MDSGFRLVVYCCIEFIVPWYQVTYVPSLYMPCMCVKMSHRTDACDATHPRQSQHGRRANCLVGESWLTYVDSTYDGFTVRHVIHRATSFFSCCLVHLFFVLPPRIQRGVIKFLKNKYAKYTTMFCALQAGGYHSSRVKLCFTAIKFNFTTQTL